MIRITALISFIICIVCALLLAPRIRITTKIPSTAICRTESLSRQG